MPQQSSNILKAKQLIASIRGVTLTTQARADIAIDLAALMLEESLNIQTAEEKIRQKQISRMMEDPKGKSFTAEMTDQCFRSNNPHRVMDQLLYLLTKYGIPHYPSFGNRLKLHLLKIFGKFLPKILVPITKHMLRKETMSVIVPGENKELSEYLKKRREEGIRINLNHLGEAILGETEALHRLQIYLDDLAQPDIEYISIKISTLFSQIHLLAWDHTLDILSERLKLLFQQAQKHQYKRPDGTFVQKFVNLDMEEYRDLHLTVRLFQKVLDDPDFQHCTAGIVLQSYIPESYTFQKELTEWAKKRFEKGGAPIKIRIVKGANLAMEKVDASLHGWRQAPYANKIDVDANFKKMLTYGCKQENAKAVRLGLGSHNLFDISYGLILSAENNVENFICFELLEGMADHIRRVVQMIAKDVLIYAPAANKEEFHNAVGYLLRRLDENTHSDNFLRYLFDLRPLSEIWNQQAKLFLKSCLEAENVSEEPQRDQHRNRFPVPKQSSKAFINEPDTDWSLQPNRKWINEILFKASQKRLPPVPLVINSIWSISKGSQNAGYDPSNPNTNLYLYNRANQLDIDKALQTAKNTEKKWAPTSIFERCKLLGKVANKLREGRGALIASMVTNVGKIIAEADSEVSEAIDFAEYYSDSLLKIHQMNDLSWDPKGTVVVASPWNFPCSIPAGGIIAALAAGNCVIFKPSTEAVLVGWELVKLFWEAGINHNVLQFLTCDDEPIGNLLIQDPRTSCVILTGATSTAKKFMKMRPQLDLIAETGGKNSMIITSMADRDLAIKHLLQSAFGYAGQKCSACSLAICEAEVYNDPHFKEQLLDAAKSLEIGSAWDPKTFVNPLIQPPNSSLLRALTTLEEGEEWILKPQQDTHNPRLWSPGIKYGVKEGSFTHQTELFGPVLGVMRANNLKHAIKLANGTAYGLTAGIHTLDEREQNYWIQNIEAGNCYINRGTTGAIVQLQAFGGMKASNFSPGAKAGGPNYLMQLMKPKQVSLPQNDERRDATFKHILEYLENYAATNKWSQEQLNIGQTSIASYVFYWKNYFSLEHDPCHLLGQDNIFKYVPRKNLTLRIEEAGQQVDIFRAIIAAAICKTPMRINSSASQFQSLQLEDITKISALLKVEIDDEASFISKLKKGEIQQLRLVSAPKAAILEACAEAGCYCEYSPVLANGRVELLRYLREVSITRDYHRYGNIMPRTL